ncbi:hypothetical protein HN51_011920 [Arachis hypogaea]
MGTPSFHEFKKQASFFLKEKIKSARLALTDITPAELRNNRKLKKSKSHPINLRSDIVDDDDDEDQIIIQQPNNYNTATNITTTFEQNF